jgi:hypothetical protein
VLTKNIPGVSGYTATPGFLSSGEPFIITAGETCSDATALEIPLTLELQSLDGYLDDFNRDGAYTGINPDGACGILTEYAYNGADGVYQVQAPADGTLDITLFTNTVALWDGALVVVTDCADIASSCMIAADNDWHV